MFYRSSVVSSSRLLTLEIKPFKQTKNELPSRRGVRLQDVLLVSAAEPTDHCSCSQAGDQRCCFTPSGSHSGSKLVD